MNSKQTYIDFILNEINNGNVRYNNVCALFCPTFGVTLQTFNKYWKAANRLYNELESAKKEAIIDSELTELKSKAKANLRLANKTLLRIIKKIDLVEEKAYDLTIGKIIVYYREPNPMEIIEAIKEYNRINGI